MFQIRIVEVRSDGEEFEHGSLTLGAIPRIGETIVISDPNEMPEAWAIKNVLNSVTPGSPYVQTTLVVTRGTRFQLGQAVRHEKYGIGRVQAIDGNKLTIDFPDRTRMVLDGSLTQIVYTFPGADQA